MKFRGLFFMELFRLITAFDELFYLWFVQLNPALFWDTDPVKLDYQLHARYIMMRVLMFGKLEEWRQVMAFYGKEKIAAELVNERELDVKSVHFLCALLDIPLDKFKCYSEKQ